MPTNLKTPACHLLFLVSMVCGARFPRFRVCNMIFVLYSPVCNDLQREVTFLSHCSRTFVAHFVTSRFLRIYKKCHRGLLNIPCRHKYGHIHGCIRVYAHRALLAYYMLSVNCRCFPGSGKLHIPLHSTLHVAML